MWKLLVQWNLVRLYAIIFNTLGKTLKLNKGYAEKFSETTGIENQGQHWGGNRKLSI